MTNDRFFADIVVNLHPDSLSGCRDKMEKELCDLSGVFSVHFDSDESRNAVFVAYNPRVITSDELLETIRRCYTNAEKTAKILMNVSSH